MRSWDDLPEEVIDFMGYYYEEFGSYPYETQYIITDFCFMFRTLIKKKESLERGEKTRHLQIALTHLEDAFMRAMKAYRSEK